MTAIQEELYAIQDKAYKDFQVKLMPTVDPDTVIGVRIPLLRKMANELWKDGRAKDFLQALPHETYEENNLHGYLIEKIRDFDEAVAAVEAFLPYVNNWATCDTMSPKVFGKYHDRLYEKIKEWIASGETYTVRFGLGMLMRWFLDENFTPEVPSLAASVHSEEYYVNMMIAWFFATSLAKQYDAILPYIEEKRLDPWTHNKAIQKAVESFRITPEQKVYLKTLKIKVKAERF